MINLNKRIKTILSMLLSTMFMSSLFAGCKSTKSTLETDGTANNPNSKPVTLNVEVFDRGTPGQPDLNNNYWTKYINDNFGKKYNVTVKFVPVPRSQEVDKLNVLMAANQAPDIIFTYDQNVAYNFVKQGGITQLDNLIEKYGQNLKQNLGEDVLNYGKFNDKQMAVPAKRTVTADKGEWIRKDWLDKLGLPVPKNKEEFYNTLVAFRDKNPGNVNGVIPWAMGGDLEYNFLNLVNSFWTEMSEKDFATLPNWQKPGNKEGVKFLNKLYNENLISPDFAIDKTSKQIDADVSSGKAGFVTGTWDVSIRSNPGQLDNLKKNVPEASLIPIDTFENYQGKYYKSEYAPNGLFIMIPKASKNSIQAVQYLNWLADSKTSFFLQNGEEGTGYKMVDGIPQLIPQTGDKKQLSPYNVDYEILFNGLQLGDPDKNTKATAKSYPGYEDLATQAMKIAYTDTYTPFWFDTPNDANAKYAKTLKDRTQEMYAKLLTCKPENFDKLYDSLVDEYMKAGGQLVKDNAIKIYDAMQTKK